MQFNPVNFIHNLKYMGLGMIGIFLVIGIVVGVVVGLNTLTKDKE